MQRDDVETAWRLFRLNWIPIAGMSAALACAAVASGFSIELIGLSISLMFVAVYAGFAYANAWSAARRDPQVMFVLGSTAQIVLITVVMSPLTYVAAAANFPLQDANLLALDRALGLDWAAYVRFVDGHPLLADWLSYGYTMIRWPLFAIPVVLVAAQRYMRLQAFTLAFGLALIATTMVSALVPAIGVYQQIGLDQASLTNLHPQAYLDQVRDLAPVRAGALRELDLFALAGIVTFPSFHAASAVLYAWALWPVRWIRPIAIVANVAMMASTPIDGGHYFVDLIAGAAVALLAIAAAKAFTSRVDAWRSADQLAAQPAAINSAVPAE
jgi:membrane-associated phospholipid phosphatase